MYRVQRNTSLGTSALSKVRARTDLPDDVTMEPSRHMETSLQTRCGICWRRKPSRSSAERAEIAKYVAAKYKDWAYVDSAPSEVSDEASPRLSKPVMCVVWVDACWWMQYALQTKTGKSALMMAVDSGSLPCVELIATMERTFWPLTPQADCITSGRPREGCASAMLACKTWSLGIS